MTKREELRNKLVQYVHLNGTAFRELAGVANASPYQLVQFEEGDQGTFTDEQVEELLLHL